MLTVMYSIKGIVSLFSTHRSFLEKAFGSSNEVFEETAIYELIFKPVSHWVAVVEADDGDGSGDDDE